jgi:hypothetical protein
MQWYDEEALRTGMSLSLLRELHARLVVHGSDRNIRR